MSLKQDLPEHVSEEAVEALIDKLADYLLALRSLRPMLEACGLQPTTRAAGLAARAAVLVLVAHELGQTVREDSDGTETLATVAGNREIYETSMIDIEELAERAITAQQGSEDLRAEMLKVYATAKLALKLCDDSDK